LKEHGNHVQILTKGNGERDFDLLDSGDWYGVTLDGSEARNLAAARLASLRYAATVGVKTWISFEPVLNDRRVLTYIKLSKDNFVNRVKIGKLNYHPSDINWKQFGQDAEILCQKLGLDYYIKDSLRAEMNKP
jgi:DNA repair photolyase